MCPILTEISHNSWQRTWGGNFYLKHSIAEINVFNLNKDTMILLLTHLIKRHLKKVKDTRPYDKSTGKEAYYSPEAPLTFCLPGFKALLKLVPEKIARAKKEMDDD